MSLHSRNAEPAEAESIEEQAVPRAHEARLISAVLANGRSVRLRVPSPRATLDDVNAIAASVDRWTERQSRRNNRTGRTLKALADAMSAQTKRSAAAWAKSERTLLARMRKGDRGNAATVTKALAAGRSEQTKALRSLDTALGRSARRALWDALVIVGMLPLSSAYGRAGKPTHVHNVTLAAVTGIWLVGDELVDVLSGSARAGATRILDTDLWSYTAPLGSFATGWWLLRDRQHLPFVAGHADSFKRIAKDTGTGAEGADGDEFALLSRSHAGARGQRWRELYHARVDLGTRLAPHFDLSTLAGAPAVATIATYRSSAGVAKGCVPTLSVRAEVVGHELVLEVLATVRCEEIDPSAETILEALNVAWMVDVFAGESEAEG